jgi:HlyD family secretion protein
MVPVAALVRSGPRWSVWALRGGRAYRVEVDVRERSPETAWIGSGLSAGQQVLLYPGTQIEDGQRVAVRETRG